MLLLAVSSLLTFAAAPRNPFELRDGDRVVFIGDTLIEREKDYGYIELMMTLRFPDRNVTFRNLGWSADTPTGISRVSFDWNKGEAEWLRQLIEQIRQTQPTVVVLGYGMASSLEDAAATEAGRARLSSARRVEATENPARLSDSRRGEDTAALPRGKGASGVSPRLEKFVRDYEKLIDAILELNKETRFILLSPIRHEKLPPPLPDPARHNDFLASYTKAIQGIAEKRGYVFVELFEAVRTIGPIDPSGKTVAVTENGIHLNRNGYLKAASAISVALGWPKFVRDDPKPNEAVPAFPLATWQLHQPLQQVIVTKNQLFFHRWRPENSTYLFLFRKHEQGKNAQEIPKFDPLIQAEEEKIAKLRRETPDPMRFPSLPKTASLTRGLVKSQNPIPDKPTTPFKPQAPVHFQLADTNLEVTLWAENPLLAKPIAMNWDARGRLWIASSSVYPQIEPGQAQDDKILVLEDTNGDGKADKTTVFADGLLIPTGVEPGDGGCYVGQSTELLHFKDTDGDGIADQRRVVLSGFGTEDTHHILHTLRWGPDGQLNMNQSIYIHSHIETPHGVVRLNSGGTLQLRPDTLELGIHMKGLINGWGHAIDDFGQSFQTDGAGGSPPNGIFWNIPQAMFVTYAGARRTLGSISPGSYPKLCGLELIKSERFPKEWQGNAITCDFRANRVVRFEILEDGAAYTTRHHEFLRTTNITFRPIDVKMGPDGALYIADWSNPIIQHGEVDFRDPRRDRVHGRIWRVGYKGGKKIQKPDLLRMTDAQLVDQLLSPNAFNSQKAERVLIERARLQGTKSQVGVSLSELGQYHTNDHAKLRALGLLHAIYPKAYKPPTAPALRREDGIVEIVTADSRLPLVHRLIEATSYQVRAAATRLVGVMAGNTPGMPSLAEPRIPASTALDLIAKRIHDDHPRVRIEALRSLARIPTARSAELALRVLDSRSSRREEAHSQIRNPQSAIRNDQSLVTSAATELDPFLEYALWLTINDLAEPWAAAVESGAWKIEGREHQLQYALKAIEPQLATRLMDKVIGEKPLPRDGSGGMIELIGQAGGPAHLRKLFDQVLNGGFTGDATARALNALAEAARLRNARPSGDVGAIGQVLERGTPFPRNDVSTPNDVTTSNARTESRAPIQAAAAKLAGAWKLASVTPALTKLAGDANGSPALRSAAIEGLRELGGRGATAALRDLTKDNNDSIRRSAAAALAAADLNGSMNEILAVVSATTKEEDAVALWRSLLAVKGSSAAFTKALGAASLPEASARAGLRVAREGGRNEPNLVLALNKAGGLSDPNAALTDEEIHTIGYDVTRGDPANGEKLYRRKELGCTLCHSIGGAGGKVGPDLTSLGASTPLADYIIESVLLPNKKVKEGYNSVQLTTTQGEEIVGNFVREDNEQVILTDASANLVQIPKRDITARKMGGSLMPSGLVDFLTPQERLDLYAFLAQLGKPGTYDATKQNVARVWRLNTKVGTVNADEMLKTDVRRGKDWTPLYSFVNGTLPKSDVMFELEGQDATVWLATRFQSSRSGPTKFKIAGTASPKAWIDGKPIGGDNDLTVDLPAGPHTFFLKVTTSDLESGLKVESNDVTFLTE